MRVLSCAENWGGMGGQDTDDKASHFSHLMGCTGIYTPANPAAHSSAPTPATSHSANTSDGHNDSGRTYGKHKGRGDFQFKCSKCLFPSLLLTAAMSTAGTNRDFHIVTTLAESRHGSHSFLLTSLWDKKQECFHSNKK